jgi:hypothetical protein
MAWKRTAFLKGWVSEGPGERGTVLRGRAVASAFRLMSTHTECLY